MNHRIHTTRQLREQDEQQPVRDKQRDDDEHADLTDFENVSGSDGDEDIYEIVDWLSEKGLFCYIVRVDRWLACNPLTTYANLSLHLFVIILHLWNR